MPSSKTICNGGYPLHADIFMSMLSPAEESLYLSPGDSGNGRPPVRTVSGEISPVHSLEEVPDFCSGKLPLAADNAVAGDSRKHFLGFFIDNRRRSDAAKLFDNIPKRLQVILTGKDQRDTA